MALISWPSNRPSAGPDATPGGQSEGIDAFVSESALAVAPVPAPPVRASYVEPVPRPRSSSAGFFKWVAVILASAAAAAFGMWVYQQRPAQPLPASLTLQTTPSGMQVDIGGKPMGRTPVTLSLDAGQYPVSLSAADGRRRDFAVTLTAGGSVVQHIEMGAAPAAPTAATGGLLVESEPSRQMVIVDGVQRGVSPLTIGDLAPGEHVVQVRTPTGTVRRTIPVEAGKTVSLVVSAPVPTGVKAGWVQFTAPVPLELRENGTVIGTTAAERVMLPAGQHEIELRNDALGFRATRQVSIAADQMVTMPIAMPNGTVSINALPWAEVWLGGQRIGETPIANLSWPIGSHQVLLRHPQLGERRATVTISAKDTARLGVDMRTP